MASTDPDALDALREQNRLVTELLDTWSRQTDELAEHGDDVDLRWQRGSQVKLLLQHLAVRETAKTAVVDALRPLDGGLAGRLEAGGPDRRRAVALLDERCRGRVGMNLNTPEIDEVVAALRGTVAAEIDAEDGGLLDSVAGALDGTSLPSARRVQMTSDTHPSPEPRWYDRVVPLKAVKSLFDSLRTTPRGGTAPSVDGAREHTPGPRD